MIRAFQCYAVARNLSFWLPVFTVYLLDRGLSMATILGLLGIQSLAQVCAEVPAGLVGDRFGHRGLLAAASVLRVGHGALLLWGESSTAFLVAHIAYGVALAAHSCSESVLLVEGLRAQGLEHTYRQAEGRVQGVGLGARAFAAVAGGGMASVAPGLPLAASIAAAVAAFVLTWRLSPTTVCSAPLLTSPTAAAAALRPTTPRLSLLALVLFTAFASAAAEVSMRLYQPYLREFGLSFHALGWLYGAWLLLSAWAARSAYRLTTQAGECGALCALPLLLAASLGAMATGVHVAGVALFGLAQIAWGLWRPVTLGALHAQLPSHRRGAGLAGIGVARGLMLLAAAALGGGGGDASQLCGAAGILAVVSLAVGLPLALVATARGQGSAAASAELVPQRARPVRGTIAPVSEGAGRCAQRG